MTRAEGTGIAGLYIGKICLAIIGFEANKCLESRHCGHLVKELVSPVCYTRTDVVVAKTYQKPFNIIRFIRHPSQCQALSIGAALHAIEVLGDAAS